MQYYNNGMIIANKPFTPRAIRHLVQNERFDANLVDNIEDNTMEILDYYGSDLDDDIDEMIQTLAPLNYVLNGEVRVSGDFDGMYFIHDNEIDVVDIEDVGLYRASDQTLINRLKQNGYTIFKNGEPV